MGNLRGKREESIKWEGVAQPQWITPVGVLTSYVWLFTCEDLKAQE